MDISTNHKENIPEYGDKVIATGQSESDCIMIYFKSGKQLMIPLKT